MSPKASFLFQHTATRRWLPKTAPPIAFNQAVSTHSHPKVAANGDVIVLGGLAEFQHTATRRWLQQIPRKECQRRRGFNTQPPEGGCVAISWSIMVHPMFQHTATRRWLQNVNLSRNDKHKVSTHSHPKVAASNKGIKLSVMKFQHTATRRWLLITIFSITFFIRGFNTQPPEGGCIQIPRQKAVFQCFNTQPPEGGC